MVKRVTADIPIINTYDAPASPESLIFTAIEDILNTQLSQGGSTHNARLDGDIQRRVCERITC